MKLLLITYLLISTFGYHNLIANEKPKTIPDLKNEIGRLTAITSRQEKIIENLKNENNIDRSKAITSRQKNILASTKNENKRLKGIIKDFTILNKQSLSSKKRISFHEFKLTEKKYDAYDAATLDIKLGFINIIIDEKSFRFAKFLPDSIREKLWSEYKIKVIPINGLSSILINSYNKQMFEYIVPTTNQTVWEISSILEIINIGERSSKKTIQSLEIIIPEISIDYNYSASTIIHNITREITYRQTPYNSGISYAILLHKKGPFVDIFNKDEKKPNTKKYSNTKAIVLIQEICKEKKILFTIDNGVLLFHTQKIDWSKICTKEDYQVLKQLNFIIPKTIVDANMTNFVKYFDKCQTSYRPKKEPKVNVIFQAKNKFEKLYPHELSMKIQNTHAIDLLKYSCYSTGYRFSLQEDQLIISPQKKQTEP